MGLGPTLPAAGPAATSTLGSEVGAKHCLPPQLPPLGRFGGLLQSLALSYQPPEGRPDLHRSLESILLHTARLWSLRESHLPSHQWLSMHPLRVHGSPEEERCTPLPSNASPPPSCYANLDKDLLVSKPPSFLFCERDVSQHLLDRAVLSLKQLKCT